MNIKLKSHIVVVQYSARNDTLLVLRAPQMIDTEVVGTGCAFDMTTCIIARLVSYQMMFLITVTLGISNAGSLILIG